MHTREGSWPSPHFDALGGRSKGLVLEEDLLAEGLVGFEDVVRGQRGQAQCCSAKERMKNIDI